MSKKEIPDFTEDLVAFMIQTMLTIVRFPRAPFALVPLSKKDELIYGADAMIESICPLYIQFKRSFAYSDSSKSKIIKDRERLGVSSSPKALYFELRGKKDSHVDYQHNILFSLNEKLRNEGSGKAFYTAPLFLNRTSYLLAVHLSSLLHWRPWHSFISGPFFEGFQDIVAPSGAIRFHNIPILQEHVVIPPHIRVETHKHKYSYNETGKEVCFHSPSFVENYSSLGQTIYNFLEFSNGQPTTTMIELQESTALLQAIQGDANLNSGNVSNNSIIRRWLNLGETLRIKYEIYQFALLKLK